MSSFETEKTPLGVTSPYERLSDEEQARLFAVIENGFDRECADELCDSLINELDEKLAPNDRIYYQLGVYKELATAEENQAHDLILESNIGLARSMAGRYARRAERLDFDDLSQEAWVALSHAIWTYQSDFGAKLSTYAFRIMANRMDRVLAYSDYSMRVPSGVIIEAASLRRHHPTALSQTLKTGKLELISGLTNQPEAVVQFETVAKHSRSVDETHGSGREDFDAEGKPSTHGLFNNLAEVVITNTHNQEAEEIEHEIVVTGAIKLLLGALEERERNILELRSGLVDGVPKTLEEVGAIFGFTRERARQIEAKAHAKIRKIVEVHLLRDREDPDLIASIRTSTKRAINNQYYEQRRDKKFGLLRQYLPRIHAWGEFKLREYELDYGDKIVSTKIQPDILLLAMADELPSYVAESTDGRYYGSEAKFKAEQQKIGIMPDVRIPEVRDYMEYFVDKVCRIMEFNRYGTPTQSSSGLIRQQIYQLLIAERLASTELFQKAMARKYDLK